MPANNFNQSINKINQKITDHITHLLLSKKISQQKLASESGIAQSTISKLLNGEANFSLNQLIRISEALKDNIFNTISSDDLGCQYTPASDAILELSETDNIILNTDRPAFKGYLNTEYNTYFLSTVSGVKDIITGKIKFKSSSSKHCEVDFTLYTGKKDILNKDIVKHYTGIMLISIPLSTCYCILKNEEIGELSFISFSHMFLLNESMRCRSCCVLTTSSGEQRRPTVNRMIISDYRFDFKDKNDYIFLFGQLKMNNKKILIYNKDLLEIEKYTQFKTVDFSNVYNKTKDSDIIEIDENLILGLEININQKIDLINQLRAVSLADSKNKISTNTDEFLYSYIQSKDATMKNT